MKSSTLGNNNRGFSLLEVLITVAVISVALVALAKFQGDLLQNSSLAKNRTTAINLAQDKMDELRATTFANLASGQDSFDPSILPGITETYARVWNVVTNGDNAAVTVTVTWSDYTTGSVNNDTTVQLASNISNSTPESTGNLIDPTP